MTLDFFLPLDPGAYEVWCGIDSPNSSTRDFIAALKLSLNTAGALLFLLTFTAGSNLDRVQWNEVRSLIVMDAPDYNREGRMDHYTVA